MSTSNSQTPWTDKHQKIIPGISGRWVNAAMVRTLEIERNALLDAAENRKRARKPRDPKDPVTDDSGASLLIAPITPHPNPHNQ